MPIDLESLPREALADYSKARRLNRLLNGRFRSHLCRFLLIPGVTRSESEMRKYLVKCGLANTEAQARQVIEQLYEYNQYNTGHNTFFYLISFNYDGAVKHYRTRHDIRSFNPFF